MGMFDEIELGDGVLPGQPRKGWQTKDLECMLDTYTLRVDGLYKTGQLDTDGGSDLVDELVTYTGELHFYRIKEPHQWIEYIATLENGRPAMWIRKVG